MNLDNNTLSKISPSFVIFFLFTIALFAYIPTVFYDYIFHDDVYYFSGDWDQMSCEGYTQYNAYWYSYGRPFGGFIKCLYGMNLEVIPDAKYIRLFNIALLSICAFVIFRWLKYCNFSIFSSFIISALIILLLPFQPTIAQITNAHHISAAILAILSLHLYSLKIYENNSTLNGVLAYIFSISSILIYPPSAMLYWSGIILLIKKISHNSKNLYFEIIKLSKPILSALIILFLWKNFAGGGEGRGEITSDIFGKVLWFFESVLPQAIKFWEVFGNKIISYSFLILVGSYITIKLYEIIKNKDYKKFKVYVNIIIITTGLVFLSFLPALLINENATPNRIFIALDTALIFLGAICIMELLNFFKIKYLYKIVAISSVLLVIYGMMIANYNVYHYYAKPNQNAYLYLKNEFKKIDFNDKSIKVHLIVSDETMIGRTYADEFIGSYFNIGGKYDVLPHALAILRELNQPITWENTVNSEFRITSGNENNFIGIATDIRKDQNLPEIENDISSRIKIDLNKLRKLKID